MSSGIGWSSSTVFKTNNGAPLTQTILSPSGDSTIAVTFLETGSKGWNSKTLYLVKAFLALGVWFVKRQFVLSQSTGLVGTQDFDTSQRFNSRQFLNNSLLLSQVSSTDSHGGGDDSWQTDWDTNNGDSQSVSQDSDNSDGSVETSNPDNQQGNNDQDQQNRTNTVQDFSEVTRTSRGLVNQSSSTTDESRVTGSGNNHESFTSLDSRRRVGGVTVLLLSSQRFTSNSGLINLQKTVFRDNSTISWDDSTVFQLQDVTWNNFVSLDFNQRTVSDNESSVSQSLLQFFDNRTGLEFLNETNGGVQQQQSTDNTEIDPIFQTSSQNSSGFHNELNWTNKEHNELEEHVFLLFSHSVQTVLLSSSGDFISG